MFAWPVPSGAAAGWFVLQSPCIITAELRSARRRAINARRCQLALLPFVSVGQKRTVSGEDWSDNTLFHRCLTF